MSFGAFFEELMGLSGCFWNDQLICNFLDKRFLNGAGTLIEIVG